MLSIIIPTLNEEKYLPKLLDSINRQNLKNFEVIISDNFSKDNTRKIAARYHCRIVDGGLPSRARNNGAYESKGNLLLFLDADVILDDDFLNPCIKEFKKRQLDVASVMFKIPKRPFDAFLLSSVNAALLSVQKISPHASGSFILCKKKHFTIINGFNERLMLAEDHDFVKRASYVGKFGILNKTIYLSMRRYDKEGRMNLLKKYMKIETYRKIKGDIHQDIFDYEFGKF